MNPLNGTKVPGQAERPATLTADALGDTLALGVTPVRGLDVPTTCATTRAACGS